MKTSETSIAMMNKLFFGALFVAFFRLSTSVSRRYNAKIDIDGNILQENLLIEYDVHSLIMCSAMCGPGCTFFGVNLQRKKCRLYTGCHSTNSAGPEVGWGYYLPDSEGNDVIHHLTKNRSSLYVSITLTNGTTLYQQYNEFSVNSEEDNYRLFLAGPTEGTLGDSMLNKGYLNDPNYPYDLDLSGMNFSTPDRDFITTGGVMVTVLLSVTLEVAGGLIGVVLSLIPIILVQTMVAYTY